MIADMTQHYILGIETSCDETAVAIITGDGAILADKKHAQFVTHQPYGGVVPELAAREHIAMIDQCTRQALATASLTPSHLTAIAATAGPGLIGGVLVGAMVGRGMAEALGIPYFTINHLEGHALMARMTEKNLAFPFLLLLVSGGHTQLLAVEGVGSYTLYGETLDDAAGEAFDKSAKVLGLHLPGGPSIETVADKGDSEAFALPRPLAQRAGCDFSFSGLKTALVTAWRGVADKTPQAQSDLAASLQQAIADCLVSRCINAMQRFRGDYQTSTSHRPHLVVSGGVAANQVIRHALTHTAQQHGFAFCAPPMHLCSDNGVMIAWAARERLALRLPPAAADFAPRPRWSLTELTADSQEMTPHVA